MFLALSFLMYPAKHQMRTLSFYHERVILFYFLSRNLAGLKRFTIGIMYLVTFTLLQPRVKGSFLATTEYDVSNSCRWPFDVIAVPFFWSSCILTTNWKLSEYIIYLRPSLCDTSNLVPRVSLLPFLWRERKKKKKKKLEARNHLGWKVAYTYCITDLMILFAFDLELVASVMCS